MNTEIVWMPGHELADKIRARDISPTEAVTAVLERLEKVEPAINAFVTVTADAALAGAKVAEQALLDPKADLGPLHGVPITVKDLCDTASVRTTYGSKSFTDHIPERDAVTWSRLKSAGAILIGKTTTPEFGMLGVTDSQLTGRTSTPWATTHTSGGSSGGAAASVASGVAPFAWGSDGGGSIRVPAACCGVVGLKASMGRFPVQTPWESVGTDGPLTRNVRDAALLMSVAVGPDARDPLSLPWTSDDWVGATIGASLNGMRIAYSPDFGTADVDHEVRQIVELALADLRSGGAVVEQVDLNLPDPVSYFQAFWTPAFADELGDDLLSGAADSSTVHPMMLEMARQGQQLGALEYYRTTMRTRGEISNGFAEVFDSFDILVTPTMPVTAFPHPGREAGPTEINGKPVSHPATDFHRLTEPPSHAGLPAITVPCGFSAEGLPVGIQFIGPRHADAATLRAAAAYESLTEWSLRRPPV
ncbi:amidase [Aeromicrobium sp. 9AM]|uniref:amidase n=1 Tax=Aeromicrobium sp. 9AM TaxID=2653126 RepID=UPI0012F3D3AF|nr:amidase [Aeromicrobium sp. 9AM]VXB14166.1 Amidase [Aeromicrobium sp. 9AM]